MNYGGDVARYLEKLRLAELLTEDDQERIQGCRWSSLEELRLQLKVENLLTPWQDEELNKGQTNFRRGSYLLQSLLKEGGMGIVYFARDATGRVAAIKEVRNANEAAKARFQQEIRVGQILVHRNVIHISEVDPDGKYFVMEYFSSKPFDAWRQEQKPSDGPILDVIVQVLAGLQYTYKYGVVHRDLKPDNILVGEDEAGVLVKIIDFGCARAREEEGDRLSTHGAFGTAAYTPPVFFSERGMMDAGVRDDLFSLGCVLFEALSGGTRPFPDDLGPRQASIKQPKSLAELRTDLPADLRTALSGVVAKILQYEAADRYQTPQDVQDALKPFRGGEWGACLAASRPPSAANKPPPLSRPAAPLDQPATSPYIPKGSSTSPYIAAAADEPVAIAAPPDVHLTGAAVEAEAREVLQVTVERLKNMLRILHVAKPIPTMQKCKELAAEHFNRFDGRVEGLQQRSVAWPNMQTRLQKAREAMGLLLTAFPKFPGRVPALEELHVQAVPSEVITAFALLIESRIAELEQLVQAS